MPRAGANPHSKNTATAAPLLRQQVYEQLRRAIEQGSLRAGTRLPPSREQASALGVSRNTVLWAVQRLQAEGYVQARVGDGTYVAQAVTATAAAGQAQGLVAPPRGLSRRGQLIADTAARWRPPHVAARAFRIGAPEVATFPFALWDRLARQASARQRSDCAQYLDPAGNPDLRSAVAQWLWASRGIRCDAAQVVVCSGSQQGIDLIARLLLDVGDEVLVEDPGYPGIRASLLGHGALARPVPLDGEGLRIDEGAALWPAARMAVVTPTHQFPTGVGMPLARRQALLQWARTHDAWVVEDDYDGEFQYGSAAQRVPALCSLPGSERVLYVGTFSKTLHPGLRLGFVVVPPALVDAFAMARAITDRHAPGDTQAVLARFIAEGHLLRHLRHMRELYPHRQAVLIDALADASDGALQLQPSDRGMQLLHEVAEGIDDEPLSRRAHTAGVMLAPLSRYVMQSPRRGWLFGYAGYAEAEIRAAARVVGGLLRR
ncbi:MocR-like pyridoxine biosynthesis transcription factor PdxR [Acidovorax sp. RAC01]|uniref:MocR-like pyridoxine biosynthesis transcription factor PdxR n=1 Tax=Acidovorax sp. RAC01 TaxID=1842533 RepID=UPI00083E95CF|nr:PLP-dependent aminotransferase family protein [Acidovorax sp. RAC01]AOG21923.1 aminotransferase class I and II family protein [Acidovorax sp. RAC01]